MHYAFALESDEIMSAIPMISKTGNAIVTSPQITIATKIRGKNTNARTIFVNPHVAFHANLISFPIIGRNKIKKSIVNILLTSFKWYFLR